MPIPSYVEDDLARMHSVTNYGRSENHNALCRIILDQILISAIYEESNKGNDGGPGRSRFGKMPLAPVSFKDRNLSGPTKFGAFTQNTTIEDCDSQRGKEIIVRVR